MSFIQSEYETISGFLIVMTKELKLLDATFSWGFNQDRFLLTCSDGYEFSFLRNTDDYIIKHGGGQIASSTLPKALAGLRRQVILHLKPSAFKQPKAYL